MKDAYDWTKNPKICKICGKIDQSYNMFEEEDGMVCNDCYTVYITEKVK